MSDVKDALLAFVRAVQGIEQGEPGAGLHSLSRHIAKEAGGTGLLALNFGFGYFDRSKVLVYLDDEVYGQAETEEAVVAYCEGRQPCIVGQIKPPQTRG